MRFVTTIMAVLYGTWATLGRLDLSRRLHEKKPRMPAERLRSLSAFFPVHDEEDNVVPMAEAILAVLPEVATAWELVIVDDGSRDATGARADALAQSRAGVRVVHHPTNRGYGAAIRSGLGAARHEWVFYTDGDRQFDPRQITRLIAALAEADVVVGWRARRADHAFRRLNTFAWNTLIRVLFGLRVRDVDCAFKLLPREALAGVVLEADGAMISTELLAHLVRRGLRVAEVPVDHFPRTSGTPSGNDPRVVLRAFRELGRLYPRIRAVSRRG
jgi:glycosyltransferase involved in cell wall biosynthesis